MQRIYSRTTQDREVIKHLTWTPHENYEQTEEWIKHCIKPAMMDQGYD